MPTVAFQGRPGAFSHLACRAARPDHQVLPCPSFEAVFDAVDEGLADVAMLPVENSRAGRVADIHRLLPQRRLSIVGEHYQPVHHQLLALPHAVPDQLVVARSHPQALAQCREFLARRGLRAEVAFDTAGAAEALLHEDDPTVAVVASSLAGEIYGLQVVARDIEDAHDNTTRFLVMAADARVPDEPRGPLVTSCLFRVRNIPSALYKALGGFATNGVNLHKLESYQLDRFRWTQFAIDFEGHPEVPAVARALEELAFFSTELRVLGTYPAHPYRFRALSAAEQAEPGI